MSEPVVTTPAKLITADEFWDFVNRPENENRRFELIRGEVKEMSRPRHPHGRLTIRIGFVLERYAEQVGKGYVVSDSGLVLAQNPDSVVGPDVAYYTDTSDFGEIDPKWAETPPVLVVEVRSPTDRPNTLIAKIRDYLRNGVKVVWLVDYEDRTVSVFRVNVTPDVFAESQELTGGDELPGFSCRVSEFFRMPGERPAQAPPPAA
jgi:Uma2 family endonuclease